MEFNDATATLEQLAREREALDGSYADLSAEMDALMAAGGPPDDIEERYRRLLGHFRRLANYLQMEREISMKLFALLQDAYERYERPPTEGASTAHQDPRMPVDDERRMKEHT